MSTSTPTSSSTGVGTSTLSKRKRSDGLPVLNTVEALQAQLRSAIATYGSAEIALLFLIRVFSFDLVTLQEALEGELMMTCCVRLIF